MTSRPPRLRPQRHFCRIDDLLPRSLWSWSGVHHKRLWPACRRMPELSASRSAAAPWRACFVNGLLHPGDTTFRDTTGASCSGAGYPVQRSGRTSRAAWLGHGVQLNHLVPIGPDRRLLQPAWPDADGARGALRCRSPVQEIGYPCRHPVRRELQRFVDMDVALGDATGGVAEQRRDRQLRKPEIAGHAGEGMAQSVRCDIVKPGDRADAVENANQANEMPVAPIGGKKKGDFVSGRSKSNSIAARPITRV